MQTLEDLISGKLKGSTAIKLSCELTELPIQLFDLTDTLELLDLSGNKLTTLPKEFAVFKKLKIAFFSDNDFTEYPEILASCPMLEMVGFKANRIKSISENSLSLNLKWLILTNNKIAELPKSIGKCTRLQKVALAGNNIIELPEEMQHCKNLELLRLSANKLIKLPEWLLTLPKLAWLAYSNNPCCDNIKDMKLLNTFDWNEFNILEKLGEGASGNIYKAHFKSEPKKEIAIKIFKGEVTSDGLPESEMNTCVIAAEHPNLVRLLGKLKNHTEQKEGLVLELIPHTYSNLGQPPNYITCTRDTFKENTTFNFDTLIFIAKQMANVLIHLHNNGIMHGDFYAHNIMIDEDKQCLLGDFGAATYFDNSSNEASHFKNIDTRAFGCLLEDLKNNLCKNDNGTIKMEKLKTLIFNCMQPNTRLRMSLENCVIELNSM